MAKKSALDKITQALSNALFGEPEKEEVSDKKRRIPSLQTVIKTLKSISYDLTKRKFKEANERTIQNEILKQLQDKWGKESITKEYSLEGPTGIQIDIDLFSTYGIELKLARELLKSGNNRARLIGQSVYYDKRKYKGNMIVAVVGEKKDEDEGKLIELAKFLKEMNVKYLYLSFYEY